MKTGSKNTRDFMVIGCGWLLTVGLLLLMLYFELENVEEVNVSTTSTIASVEVGPNRMLQEYCYNGYRFLVYEDNSHAAGMTQIWENSPSGPRPAQCAETAQESAS